MSVISNKNLAVITYKNTLYLVKFIKVNHGQKFTPNFILSKLENGTARVLAVRSTNQKSKRGVWTLVNDTSVRFTSKELRALGNQFSVINSTYISNSSFEKYV